MIACRRLPTPLSVFVVTTGLVTHATTVVPAGELSLSGLGSDVSLLTVAWLKYKVLFAVPGGMCPVSVKTWPLLTARLGFMHVSVPPDPGVRLLHVQPAGALFETKVMSSGRVSVNVAFAAAFGPPLVT